MSISINQQDDERNNKVRPSGPVFKGGDASSFIEEVIKNFVPGKPEEEKPDPVSISVNQATQLASRYGKAWNVGNYLPASKTGYYSIKDLRSAIVARFDSEKAYGATNCNCDGGNFVQKGNELVCKDGKLDVAEARAANIDGEYLFGMGQDKDLKTVTYKGTEQF